jgi:UDP-glucuronate decarboxylase
LKNEPITIYGDGTQSRSFCYVSDLVDGIYKYLILPSAAETPINLGNPNEFTMIELAELVIEITKSKSQLVKLPLPLDDPRQRRPDISKANSLLGWKPNIELMEGIQRTTEYFTNVILK